MIYRNILNNDLVYHPQQRFNIAPAIIIYRNTCNNNWSNTCNNDLALYTGAKQVLALWKWYELLVLYYYSSYSDKLIGVLDVKKFEDTKDVIRSRISKNRQYNDKKKKDKPWSTRHYIEN